MNNAEAGIVWTFEAYTPTWSATGTAPSLGSGTIAGRWVQRGKAVHCYGKVTFGSSTTFGTGTYKFSVPVDIAASHDRVLGMVDGFDSSAVAAAVGMADRDTASTFQIWSATTYQGSRSGWTNTVPYTWASGDFIAWSLFYEAA